MEISEITFMEALKMVKGFCPCKVVFNGIELYNDYDSNRVIEVDEKGAIIGENKPYLSVVPERLWQYDHYMVTSIKIDIVDYHHSVISMEGYFEKEIPEYENQL